MASRESIATFVRKKCRLCGRVRGPQSFKSFNGKMLALCKLCRDEQIAVADALAVDAKVVVHRYIVGGGYPEITWSDASVREWLGKRHERIATIERLLAGLHQ